VINRESIRPPWQQIAAILRARIADGTYPAGAKMPSVLTLSEEFGVAQPTARKAVEQLKAEGLLTAVAGWGTFVSEDVLN
jgi:GntR family transcriptional regulator